VKLLASALVGVVLVAIVLAQPSLRIGSPIEGLKRADIRDTFNETHNGHRHEAVDIMEPRGTPVDAVVSGTIQKLFVSKDGGNTVYEFDDAGTRCYYYAHLDRYATGVREGMRVHRGDVIAYVGSTGNADPRAPHLHFAIFELGPKHEWWKGMPIDPFPSLVDAAKS
jgi:peptidoglycan LD-endopeptidase LytH